MREHMRPVHQPVTATCIGLTAILFLSACSESTDGPQFSDHPYADESMWLCKPDISTDRCLQLDQTTTFVSNDGNMAVFEHEPVADAEFDCFYVYPTVDFGEQPGNTLDLSDDTLMLRPLYNQAARFSQLCNVFAPKYRQMTISSYGVDDVFNSEFFNLAYSDVEQAFDLYLAENPDRNFVLMSHSQGSHILIDLLAKRFDNNDALKSRLISALTLGPTGRLQAAAGDSGGVYLQNIPLCTQASDTGCIVAYDSIAAGSEALRPEPAQARPCVNPTLLGGEPGIAAATIYSSDEGIPFPAGVETDWIALEGLYSARCETDGYLGIDTAPGQTTTFTPQLIQAFLGGDTLHQTDYNFAMSDLLRLVETQAANH